MRSQHAVGTDDAGNFRFAGLEPGLYQLNATLPGYVPEVDPLTGRPGATHRPGDSATLRLARGGVITGSVTDQQGEPLVALAVRALRVRDLDGSTPRTPFPISVEDRTDDRGVYRIYGLRPGTYVLFAGGFSSSAFGPVAAYGGDTPTFFPSGTRDTAAEVTVRGGQEVQGIDIRYRGEQGRRVTGTVDFPAATVPGDFGVGVILTYAPTGIVAASAGVGANTPGGSFSIEGVADGDYDLQATGGGREGLSVGSAPQRVSVKGSDVTGLRVTVSALASAAGTLRIEPLSEAERAREACRSVRAAQLPQEILVAATPERERAAAANRPRSRLSLPQETAPDERGAFSVRALEPGRYRLSFRLFDESLYVRSVELPAAPATARVPAAGAAGAVAHDLFEVRWGQQLTGLFVRLGEGAAALSGRVAPAEGAAPPQPSAQARLHLVPRERERGDDPARFYETSAAGDGAFSFKNLAPGRYLLLARPAADGADAAARPAAWDAETRARLRREAEAGGTPVELQPCQRTSDFAPRYPAK